MRRADRLFQIIQWLRGRRRAVTAAWLAEQLGVSERTVYRDIRDLMASGTPIDGEAGVGYRLARDYDLPPLMFDPEELEALVLGARLAAAIGDESLVRPARSALSKVEAALPPQLRLKLSRPPLFAPRTGAARAGSAALLSVRSAMGERRKLRLRYQNEKGEESERVVRPLGAFFWGKSWTVAAWCELRNDFRNFRLDRIVDLTPTAETFEDEPGRRLRDYLRQIGEFAEAILDD
ncbi:MAG: helix-turn-helix transcriptional regulator [Vicinamibacteria bacterium]